MNSSITEFLDDDEDETMHSEADVNAFTAALNKDIEGEGDDVSTRTDAGVCIGVDMQVPFALLLPFIQSQLDKDRAMQLRSLYDRLKSNDINKNGFIRRLKNLVGEHMIEMAVYKLEFGKLSGKQNTQNSSPYIATSSSDSSTLPIEYNLQKTRLLDHQSDSHGLQHMGFPHSSFSTYGNVSGNFHTDASPNTNMSSPSLQMHQGLVLPTRMHGGSSHFTSNLPNLSHWQPSMHKGPSSFLLGQHGQASRVSGSSKDNTFEMPSRPGFTAPINTPKPGPRAIIAQLERQNPSAGNLSSAGGSNAKTPPNKSTVGQKKPLQVPHVSSLSKKPKVRGAFSGQSIDELNDVTVGCGVNIWEEEEQLFGGFKDESRVSEASRKIVQEEDERLILQKVPLQKKVAEIMAKCGVKNKSNDVEWCMSQCVVERMHGLITNLIRVSKQRVDIEKPKHRTVITSDVWQQILSLNQKAREEYEEKQADSDKLQRTDKVNKEKDDEMTAAANVAARAALGGHDVLSKWQLRTELARQKRKSGSDAGSGSQSSVGVGLGAKPVSTSEMTSSPVTTTSGPIRKPLRNQDLGQSGDSITLPRTISVKDVISVLTREIHMSRSTLIHHLYEKV